MYTWEFCEIFTFFMEHLRWLLLNLYIFSLFFEGYNV